MAKKKKASTPLPKVSNSLSNVNRSSLGASFVVGESSKHSAGGEGLELVIPPPQPSAGPIPRRDLEFLFANHQRSASQSPAIATGTNGTVTSS